MESASLGSEKLGPIFEKLETMVRAGRNAFNRHSREDLENLKRLHGLVTAEITGALQSAGQLAAQKQEAERAAGLWEQSCLTRLQAIADNLAGLADPLEKKIKGGILFSDKAVSQSNALFDSQAGLLKTLLDIMKTGNEVLKKFAEGESRKLIQNCIDFATEHEARLIEGLCLPQAAPIFLAILDRMRTVAQHEEDVAGTLAAKP